jgi:hypothetical protein
MLMRILEEPADAYITTDDEDYEILRHPSSCIVLLLEFFSCLYGSWNGIRMQQKLYLDRCKLKKKTHIF